MESIKHTHKYFVILSRSRKKVKHKINGLELGRVQFYVYEAYQRHIHDGRDNIVSLFVDTSTIDKLGRYARFLLR